MLKCGRLQVNQILRALAHFGHAECQDAYQTLMFPYQVSNGYKPGVRGNVRFGHRHLTIICT